MVRFRSGVLSVVVALALASAALAGCSSDSGKTVDATLTDFAIGLAPTSIGAGDVTFKVENKGTFVHELVVAQYGGAADLPTKANGEVDEEAIPAVKSLGEVADVQPDSTKSFELTLPAGKYVLFCNRVDGDKVHFKEGMYALFTVTS